jgi:hypothetical protein
MSEVSMADLLRLQELRAVVVLKQTTYALESFECSFFASEYSEIADTRDMIQLKLCENQARLQQSRSETQSRLECHQVQGRRPRLRDTLEKLWHGSNPSPGLNG